MYIHIYIYRLKCTVLPIIRWSYKRSVELLCCAEIWLLVFLFLNYYSGSALVKQIKDLRQDTQKSHPFDCSRKSDQGPSLGNLQSSNINNLNKLSCHVAIPETENMISVNCYKLLHTVKPFNRYVALSVILTSSKWK